MAIWQISCFGQFCPWRIQVLRKLLSFWLLPTFVSVSLVREILRGLRENIKTQNLNLDGFQNSSLSVFTMSVSMKIGSGFTVSEWSRFTMLVSRKIGGLQKRVMHSWTGLVWGQGGRIAETRWWTFVPESKVQLFWEGHKNLKKSPAGFDATE